MLSIKKEFLKEIIFLFFELRSIFRVRFGGKMKKYWKWICIISTVSLLGASAAFANTTVIRWTALEDPVATFEHVVQVLNQKTGRSYKTSDFRMMEDRNLAFNHYTRYAQVLNQLPIQGKSIRIWTELRSDKTVQVEAALEQPTVLARSQRMLREVGLSPQLLQMNLTSELTLKLVRQVVSKYADDPFIRGVTWNDVWFSGDLFRTVQVRGKRGTHLVWINLRNQTIAKTEYNEFPQGDTASAAPTGDSGEDDAEKYQTIQAMVYPIYEEADDAPGSLLPRVTADLRYIQKDVRLVNGDIYQSLKNQKYPESKYDPILGETPEGRAKGYWAMSFLKQEASKIRSALPNACNNFERGMVLEGKYATINLHPDAIKGFGNLNFTPASSPALFPNWIMGTEGVELSLETAFYGRPLKTLGESLERVARRVPDNNPLTYLEDGFDEIQVYYAINTLFESLARNGWKDPELSTRPFNAFLYNPDISYKDNAYYTEDTINFTTYSPSQGNMARDNSTIWHELGHGVMDRMMGDQIQLADTGGLSEGMADFIAAMVIQYKTQGVPFPGSTKFRINNKTGFNLTNEVHDDGEAYGGAMKDFMDGVLKAQGKEGLHKVIDLVLETMRLTRDYPGLTASDWFNHMIFADSIGREGLRAEGELKSYILAALAERNFKLDGGEVASFQLMNEDTHEEVVAGRPGSRNFPIVVSIAQTATAKYHISAKLKSSDSYKFQYPVEVRVQFTGGPLQGAIHWNGKEKGTQTFVLKSERDFADVNLEVTGKCDQVNRPDGSCVDYTYVQIFNQGESHPVAKKRFYLRVKNPS